ncbi:MAG: hypothetical protein QOI21_3115 [Actinomycetota bacterium]|nr:hypothetical protein [Actinomycetota bacterium]
MSELSDGLGGVGVGVLLVGVVVVGVLGGVVVFAGGVVVPGRPGVVTGVVGVAGGLVVTGDVGVTVPVTVKVVRATCWQLACTT